MTGTMEYDSAVANWALKYDSNNFKELFAYKPDLGVSGNYTEQFLYETGANSICGKCQRLVLNAEMPLFADPPGAKWAAGLGEKINGRDCKTFTYTGTNTDPNQPNKIALVANDDPCAVTFVSGRQLTFQAATPAAAPFDFSIPTDCQCHKRLDLVISLDSSCSIDNSEWAQICDFVNKLVKQFTFGPDAAALAMVGYWGNAKTMIPLLDDGAKLLALTTGVMTRPNGPECGTNVLKGYAVHDAETIPMLRTGATPVFLTITDGADANGVPAIAAKIADYKTKGIKDFLSVFIGQQTTTGPQMLALAGDNPSRTFTYADFTAFTTAASAIQTAACTSNVPNGGCGAGCCGMCMCGTCVTPNQCDDGLACTTETLKDTATVGLQCCEAPNPIVCTPANLCEDPKCVEPTGTCNNDKKVCPPKNPLDPCLNESKCDNALGCQTIDKCNPRNCDDSNACTLDVINTTTATCSHSLIPCDPVDACHTAACDAVNGCVQTPINVSKCDDFNVCTDDTCDPKIGCSNVPKAPCNDGKPCTDDRCDPLKGCVSDIKSCPGKTKPRCKLGVCVNGTCGFQSPPLCKDEILAVGLTGGAIAGIVIALIVAAALGAFGVFKGVQAYNASKDLDDSGMNNPLYEMGGKYGESGIYVAAK